MNRMKIFFGIAIVGLFFISLTFASATLVRAQSASDADHDGVDDTVEAENKRVVEVSTDASGFTIHSKSESQAREDQLEITVNVASNLKIALHYDSESDSGEFELEFDIVFYKLVEYVDVNANGIYDPLEDTKVQELALVSFGAPTYTTETAADGTTIHVLTAKTTDNVFEIQLRVLEQFNVMNGTVVSPGEGKIDIKITNFPYNQGGSDLALYVRLESQSEYEAEAVTDDESNGYSSDEVGVETSETGFSGFFTWAETAMIDGVAKPVKASVLAQDEIEPGEHMIYLCYPRGTNIVHDPKIGVEGITAPTSFLGWVILIAVIGGAIAVVAMVYRRRQAQ